MCFESTSSCCRSCVSSAFAAFFSDEVSMKNVPQCVTMFGKPESGFCVVSNAFKPTKRTKSSRCFSKSSQCLSDKTCITTDLLPLPCSAFKVRNCPMRSTRRPTSEHSFSEMLSFPNRCLKADKFHVFSCIKPVPRCICSHNSSVM